MTDRVPSDLDAALAALERDERASWPSVSESLQARVLGDASVIAAGRVAVGASPRRRSAERRTGLRLLGLFDAWAGAAAAALLLSLTIGAGIGYGGGADVMKKAGLDGTQLAQAAEDDDGAFLWEDVL